VIPQIVLAPLAGGPSTPELAAAVANAGGLGFVAGGYLAPDTFAERLARARELTDGPLGANLFVVEERPVDDGAVAAYADELAREGLELGEPRFDDDALAAKTEVALQSDVDVVSTTFGPPPHALVLDAHAAGKSVWATVSTVADAELALDRRVDVLVLQGIEAGGHRSAYDDADATDLPLQELVRAVRALTDAPLVAAGGIGDRSDVETALAAGADAVQCGTAFLLCPEAGTSDVHRDAIRHGGETAFTRAFTGRRARGIVNRFMREHADAPSAYPQLHHLTAPMRAAARASGDAERVNLWAGTALAKAREAPAAEIVASLRA
jgi:nitronate monooxygenase